MVSMLPFKVEAPVATDSLIQLLRDADASLGHLRERAGIVVAQTDPAALGYCPKQMKTLCAILDHGRGRIQRRLSILMGSARNEDEDEPNWVPPTNILDPLAFMAEYRACCRLLCRALSEGRRIANTPAVAMLSDFVLRLEKQLWLMDTPKNHHGTDPYRSVSLFLTC
jgi:hypothetical protein